VLRLAFDLDGVFADLGAHLGNARVKTPPDVPEDAVPDHAGEPNRSRPSIELPFETTHLRGAGHEVWNRLRAIENFWETLDEIDPGSVRRLGTLTRERRWEVIFLTSRPTSAGDSVQLQTQRWLERLGFPLPSVFVTKGSRGKVAAALSLDLVVDDNPENCLDIAMESEAKAILVWRGATDAVPASVRRLGIGAVSTMGECLQVIEKADGERRRSGGFLGAFKRLFGLTVH
jgi:hypothetical protein